MCAFTFLHIRWVSSTYLLELNIYCKTQDKALSNHYHWAVSTDSFRWMDTDTQSEKGVALSQIYNHAEPQDRQGGLYPG